jgi:hypothetical protein
MRGPAGADVCRSPARVPLALASPATEPDLRVGAAALRCRVCGPAASLPNGPRQLPFCFEDFRGLVSSALTALLSETASDETKAVADLSP